MTEMKNKTNICTIIDLMIRCEIKHLNFIFHFRNNIGYLIQELQSDELWYGKNGHK